jgi:hypothetical protein
MPVPSPWSERSDSDCRSYSHDLGSIRELLTGRERELALATADLAALRAHVADLRAEQRLALDQMSERLLAVSGTAESAADVARAAKQAAQAASAALPALSEECAGVKEALVRLERRQVRRAPTAWRLLRATRRRAHRPVLAVQRQLGDERGEASEVATEQLARLEDQTSALGRAVRALADERPEVAMPPLTAAVPRPSRRSAPVSAGRFPAPCSRVQCACNRVQCACSCMRW